MGKQVTVTAKVPAELKKKLNEFGANVSGLVRDALEREVERLERERLRNLAEEAAHILYKIPAEELVESIRLGREAR